MWLSAREGVAAVGLECDVELLPGLRVELGSKHRVVAVEHAHRLAIHKQQRLAAGLGP